MKAEDLCRRAVELGAAKAVLLKQKDLIRSAEFRKLCEKNQCGSYGKCWMCPPDCGDIHDLMQELERFDTVLWYQSIHPLEDSFDIEGMTGAAESHSYLALALRKELEPQFPSLHLTSGGCRLCPVCAKETDEPCRRPGDAMSSLEAYGIDVYQSTAPTELHYMNGKNTVTYFGAVLFQGGESPCQA